jgi:hypothetical protein
LSENSAKGAQKKSTQKREAVEEEDSTSEAVKDKSNNISAQTKEQLDAVESSVKNAATVVKAKYDEIQSQENVR